ncbi:MAG: hypothetical protein VXZ35_08415 [Pseudomonadota bacterium]|nr:hypothetical protein [Candidatus Thermoplasmatota archaeon]MEC8428435.1 hypothetical protein [Pseudomonadota bacterium]
MMSQAALRAQAPGAANAAGSGFPPKLDMGLNSQVAQGASEDKAGDDNYSDEKWDVDDDFDNNKQKQNGQAQDKLNGLNFHQEKEPTNFYGFANDKQGSPSDDGKLFDNEFEDLEKEFNQNQQNDGKLDNQFNQGKNPFANSITKDILVKSKQDIEDELGKNIFEDNKNTQGDDLGTNNKFNKKNLEIDIDENVPFDLENEIV